eukprot:7293638-Prymnesium_polylepis.1
MGSRHVGQSATASPAARSRATGGSVVSSDSSRFFSATSCSHPAQPKHLRATRAGHAQSASGPRAYPALEGCATDVRRALDSRDAVATREPNLAVVFEAYDARARLLWQGRGRAGSGASGGALKRRWHL